MKTELEKLRLSLSVASSSIKEETSKERDRESIEIICKYFRRAKLSC